VVISIDTLRADDAAEMTVVKRLAARGAYWPRAMSTSSWTLPAVASIQTGLLPQEHGADCLAGVHCQGMVEGVPLLAEDLSEQGYATGAFLANAWLSRSTGFAPGFQSFTPLAVAPFDLKLDMVPPKDEELPGADQVVDAAIAWLDATPNPSFYLWVHLLDPHMPFVNAEEESHRAVLGHDLRLSRPWTPQMQAELRESYRGEIAHADEALERLLDALEKRGVLDEGIVVLTADHGEEFWEHGDIEHGHSHHGEVVDVPLVLVAPGVAAGVRGDLASLVDVASTVRAATGMEPGGFDLRAPLPADRVAQAWGTIYRRVQCSARDATRRLIADECDPTRARLYDLVHDVEEQYALVPATGDPLLEAIGQLTAAAPHGDEATNTAALEALGYVDR
jgi:arylsulfatase